MRGIGRRWRKGGRKRKKETDLILERGHLSHRVVPSDERLRRYERALLMAVYSLHLSLQQLSPEYLQENRDTWEPLLGERRVWKLARHQNPFVSHFPLGSLPPRPHLFFLSFSLPPQTHFVACCVLLPLFSPTSPLPPSSSSPSPPLLPLPLLLLPLSSLFLLPAPFLNVPASYCIVSVPDPKPTPARIAFSITHKRVILEVIYAPDEVWGRDYSLHCVSHHQSLLNSTHR